MFIHLLQSNIDPHSITFHSTHLIIPAGTRLFLGTLACENRELICCYFPFIGGMAKTFDRVKATDDYKRLNIIMAQTEIKS